MTNTLRKIALGAMLAATTVSAVTMTSCNKEDKTCSVGLSGSDCKTEVRTSYYNSYKGSGTDNNGDTYTDWTAKFSALGTDVTKMNLQLLDDNLSSVAALTVTLTSNTAFTIDTKTTSDGYTYSGTGSISASTCTLSITQKEVVTGITITTVITFNNMVKQ
ncbi:MAG: hypothetical protein QM743_01565 [Chitinophagaceae bacterium]|uniref:Lipoprotein n=1 Tax=Rurimicrobium arvi TaxID=2049916 RepID=A0ABP8ML91_9BACT